VCGTCHQESNGWTITPAFAQSRSSSDPLFVFDGSDCLPPGVSNANPAVNSTHMLDKALVRVDLAIPATAGGLPLADASAPRTGLADYSTTSRRPLNSRDPS
jgi:hypothetical protein